MGGIKTENFNRKTVCSAYNSPLTKPPSNIAAFPLCAESQCIDRHHHGVSPVKTRDKQSSARSTQLSVRPSSHGSTATRFPPFPIPTQHTGGPVTAHEPADIPFHPSLFRVPVRHTALRDVTALPLGILQSGPQRFELLLLKP